MSEDVTLKEINLDTNQTKQTTNLFESAQITSNRLAILYQSIKMADQVKYTQKLKGDKVLVIGGSSGQSMPFSDPTPSLMLTYRRHRFRGQRSLRGERLQSHHLIIQPITS